ncbi:winged helix-turn-helix transcriptional regulator [Vibrio alginolyticus]|nr:winged helix-turn-helix transcriptional regulator [Vibrio alginolyticus]EHA1120152.1 winged helix-turn-helix transcriptional regulator [Vibrio alginolyticus]
MLDSKVLNGKTYQCQHNGVHHNDEELLLDKRTHSVVLNYLPNKKSVQLTSIQFKLLQTLTHHQDQVLSKHFLYETVLKREFTEHDRALDMHMSRMRKRLVHEGVPTDRIQTVHRQGYIFKRSDNQQKN